MPWGVNSAGTSVFRNWLSTSYDETTFGLIFDHIKTMGVQTVGVWLWLDRFIDKSAGNHWGRPHWKPRWNQTYLDNFTSLLKNVVIAKDMELLCSLLVVAGGDEPTWEFETDCLVPNPASPYLIDANTSSGDLAALGSGTDNWKVVVGQASQVTFQSKTNGTSPNGGASEFLIDGTDRRVQIRSPIVSYTSNSLLHISVDLMEDSPGAASAFLHVIYYDSDNTSLLETTKTITLTSSWATYSTASQVVPAVNAAKVAVVVNVVQGRTVRFGGARIAYANDTPKYNNYIEMATDFMQYYGPHSPNGGDGILAWSLVKEGYDNVGGAHYELSKFYRDLYQSIDNFYHQPICLDTTASAKPAYLPSNADWYTHCDFIKLHDYSNAGYLVDMAARPKTIWVLGECGADNSDGSPSSLYGAKNENATRQYYRRAHQQGAKCAMAYSWTDNTTVATKSGTTYGYGAAGRAIKDLNLT